MSVVKVCRAVLTVLVLVFPLFPGAQVNDKTVSARPQQIEMHEWMLVNYPAVLNALLPKGDIPPGDFPEDAQWIVTIRILPGSEDEPECRLSLKQNYDGQLEGSVITAGTSSVHHQLRELRMRHPDATIEHLAKMLSIDKSTLSAADKPQLRELARQFEKIKTSPVLPDVLYMHPTLYEFWSQSLHGNRMQLVYYGPGPKAKQQPHPLLHWAEDFRRTVEGYKKP